MKAERSILVAALLILGVAARDVPANVRSFYNSTKTGRCTGSDKLQGGFFDEEGGSTGRQTHEFPYRDPDRKAF